MIDQLLGRPLDYGTLHKAAEELQRQLDAARLDNARLRAENRRLRAHNGRLRADLRRLRRAHADAACMAAWHAAGLSTSRRDCVDMGMSERSWAAARGLLVLGRLHSGRRWLTEDPQALAAGLSYGLRRAEESPLAWRARLPRH